MMSHAFHLTTENGIGRLVFDLPGEKVNKFSARALEELDARVEEVSRRRDLRALVLASGKQGVFVAGADIDELAAVTDPDDAAAKSRAGQAVFNRLASLPLPTVAVIDGACLGGGLELALACSHRLVTDAESTRLGFPEVNLGILPGWGGTWRLVHLVGLVRGLDMILTGRRVTPDQAYRMKLADALVPAAFVEEGIQRFVAKLLTEEGRRAVAARRRRRGMRHLLLERNPAGRWIVFRRARQRIVQKTGGHYPAPLKALEVIRKTCTRRLGRGLEVEAAAFASLAPTPLCKNLVQLFTTQQALKKETGAPPAVAPAPIASAGVLGAGVMGGGIAWLFSQGGIPVRMKDLDWAAIARGFATAHGYYQALVKRRKLSRREVNLRMHRLSGTLDYSGFQNVDIVVEAIVENLEVKKKVLAEVEAVVKPGTVLATNTSSLSVDAMAPALEHPERFVGLHFFNPVNRMPLVEVVPGERTRSETVATAVHLVRALGKTPVIVRNCPGFLVNRILLPYMNEAALMLQEGAGVERIDRILAGFGMPMGPLALADEVGIDVGYEVARNLEAAYGDRMRVAPVLGEVSRDKERLGKKSRKGFYLYTGKGRSPNPEIAPLASGGRPANGNGRSALDGPAIVERALLIMVNEAARCLEEHVVEKPEYLDMALIMGTGFPAFRGGLLRYADARGIANVVESLERLAASAGDRFAPCARLRDMARRGERFYAGGHGPHPRRTAP